MRNIVYPHTPPDHHLDNYQILHRLSISCDKIFDPATWQAGQTARPFIDKTAKLGATIRLSVCLNACSATNDSDDDGSELLE